MKIGKSKIAQRIRRFNTKVFILLRKIELPGFKNIGLYDVLRFFVDGLSDPKFSLMAAAIAFNFFFSLFPMILLGVIIVRRLPFGNLHEEIYEFFLKVMPEQGAELIDGIFNNPPEHDLALITLTIFLALRGAVKGFLAMTRAFNKDVEVFKRRNVFQIYGTAIVMLFVLGGLFLFSISVLASGEYVAGYLRDHQIINEAVWVVLLKGLNYIISLALLIFSISAIYYLAPATQRRWKFFTPGSFLASFLTLLTVVGFSWFFSNFGNFDKIYGSIATIILLMLWFYYISIVLLIGFELNAAIDLASFHKSARPKFQSPDEMKEEIIPSMTFPEKPSSTHEVTKSNDP